MEEHGTLAVLRLRDLSVRELGNYSCQAENNQGRARDHIELSGNAVFFLQMFCMLGGHLQKLFPFHMCFAPPTSGKKHLTLLLPLLLLPDPISPLSPSVSRIELIFFLYPQKQQGSPRLRLSTALPRASTDRATTSPGPFGARAR